MTLFGRRSTDDGAGGSLEDPRYPITAARIIDWLGGSATNDSGITVTPQTSLAMSAVFRCVALVSGLGGELPLVAYRKNTFTPMSSRLLEEPHPDLTPFELWRIALVHRGLWGNSYAQKVRNRAGAIVELWPIRPDRVTPGRARPSAENPSGKVFEVVDDWGRSHPLTPREIFHVPHLGYDGISGLSPITLARQAIGMGLAAEAYAAKLFGSGNLLSGFIKTQAKLDDTKAQRLQEKWRDRMLGRYSQHDIAILDAGAEFQQLTMPNSDAQFLESRIFQIPEIGRWFGVPPFLLFETSKSTSWGTGLEQQATGFTMFDLGPQWLTPIEQRVSRELLPPAQEARYQRHKLLRGDSKARADYYAAMRQWGGFSANDVLAEEGREPVEGGDLRLQPMNFAPLGSDPTRTNQAPDGQGDPPGTEPDPDDDPDGQPDEDGQEDPDAQQ